MKQVIDQSTADIHRGGTIGGFYVRHNGPYAKGQVINGGEHFIDHCTNHLSGKKIVRWISKSGESMELHVMTPCKYLIAADIKHEFEILEDGTEWECWFSEAEANAKGIDKTVDYSGLKP